MADQPKAPAAMPQPTEEHRKLHVLAGSWEGEEKISPSPWGPGGAAVGRFEGRVALDGFHVLQDYVEEKDGRVVFQGHGVFGWDAAERTYTRHWFDIMGMISPAPARGRWEGDTLTFELSFARGQGRYTYRFEGPTVHSFTLENSFDDGKTWNKIMEGKYRKK